MSLIPNDLPTNGSDHTPNLNLPVFVRTEDDKPSWFTDWNSTVETIDKNFGELQTTANATATVLENVKNTDDAQNTQIKDLQEITMSTSESLQDLTVTVNDHTNKIDNIEQDLITQNTAVKQAQTDIAQLKTSSGSTSTEVDSLTRRVGILEDDVVSNSQKISGLETDIGGLNADVDDLRSTLSDQKPTPYCFSFAAGYGAPYNKYVQIPAGFTPSKMLIEFSIYFNNQDTRVFIPITTVGVTSEEKILKPVMINEDPLLVDETTNIRISESGNVVHIIFTTGINSSFTVCGKFLEADKII